MPLRSGQAQLAVVESYADRDSLGSIVAEGSAQHNEQRLSLLEAG